MKLYFFPFAPNPTKVRTYLAEKRIEVEKVVVNLREGAQREPGFLAKNPLGKLPVLELENGTLINESLPIIEYFEELHPDPPMWGTTPSERAIARNLERICDFGVLVSVALLVHATKSPLGWPPNPGVAEQARNFLHDNLTVVDDRIGAGPWVAGERITVADCTLHAGLQFGQLFDVDLEPAFENVVAWHERFKQRPSANL